jgi:hypothetical protein
LIRPHSSPESPLPNERAGAIRSRASGAAAAAPHHAGRPARGSLILSAHSRRPTAAQLSESGARVPSKSTVGASPIKELVARRQPLAQVCHSDPSTGRDRPTPDGRHGPPPQARIFYGCRACTV